MKIQWEIEADALARVCAFYDEHKINDFVAHRYGTIIEVVPRKFSRSRVRQADGFVFGYNTATVRPYLVISPSKHLSIHPTFDLRTPYAELHTHASDTCSI